MDKCAKKNWNGLKFDFKKFLDYHTWTRHHTSLWELTMEKRDKHHLPRQFNEEFYDAIESFQGERVVAKPLHVRNIHAEGDGLYIPPPKKIH
jgi:hypothetical protein